MATINVSFNDTNYSIDESVLSAASAQLKSHLSTVMNGSGATINLGGTSYNVDSAKLQTATNAFISHLGTVAGSGSKVVVGGVEYSIDSTKMASAIADLHTVLGGLNTGGGNDGTFVTLIFEDDIGTAYIEQFNCYVTAITPPPFSLTVGEKYKVVWDGQLYDVEAVDGSAVGCEVIMGNGTPFGLDGNDEPFAVVYTSNSDVTFVALTDTAISWHTVAVYKVN